MKKINYPALIFSIVLCESAGIIGSLFTASAISTWYVSLIKPSFSPPNWLFGPVWVTLYLLMGVSLYLIWKKGKKNSGLIKLFLIHLVLNAFWSVIFFGFKNLGLAFAEIMILWVIILYLALKFYKVNKTAAYLLVPYQLWVSFAAILNLSIWLLNR
jgi:benzodiazapine receptor